MDLAERWALDRRRRRWKLIRVVGTWLAQRSIMRTNVTALKFIDGGDALLGGTREGAVCVDRRVGYPALITRVALGGTAGCLTEV
jgi:hypothetical protein